MDMIKVSVPATLTYRDMVLRVVASSCRLVRTNFGTMQDPSRDSHEFDDKVVSAVGEAFNNVAIHAYRDRPAGLVELELEMDARSITIRLKDDGGGFSLAAQPNPHLETLPESKLGLYIVRSFMDQVTYRPGNSPTDPNVLTLFKRYESAED
ncbi:MAG TPA: ATP-binding protein [Polyangiaceae bacterium]|jgi:serine/threonine-protein kinase RsbW|nr:ATP-binding protein [Polyangiaceae bacterium]